MVCKQGNIEGCEFLTASTIHIDLLADNLNIIYADIYPACRWKMVQRRGSRKGRGKGAKRKNGRGAEMEEVGEREGMEDGS